MLAAPLTVQHGAARGFQQRKHILDVVPRHAHLQQRFLKMREQRVEVRIVQTLRARAGMGGGQVAPIKLTRAAHQHRKKHGLPGAQHVHVRLGEKKTETRIGLHALVENLHQLADGGAAADFFIQAVNH